jgi:hypothetical protein
VQLAWHTDAGCIIAGVAFDAARGNIEQWRCDSFKHWFAGWVWCLIAEAQQLKAVVAK